MPAFENQNGDPVEVVPFLNSSGDPHGHNLYINQNGEPVAITTGSGDVVLETFANGIGDAWEATDWYTSDQSITGSGKMAVAPNRDNSWDPLWSFSGLPDYPAPSSDRIYRVYFYYEANYDHYLYFPMFAEDRNNWVGFAIADGGSSWQVVRMANGDKTVVEDTSASIGEDSYYVDITTDGSTETLSFELYVLNSGTWETQTTGSVSSVGFPAGEGIGFVNENTSVFDGQSGVDKIELIDPNS